MNLQDVTPNGASSLRNPPQATEPLKDQNMVSVEQLILNIINPNCYEAAMLELSKKKENFPDLAPLLWNSACTIAALLQEVLSIYPDLSLLNLNDGAANRVCLQRTCSSWLMMLILSVEIVPACLRMMELGSELSKTKKENFPNLALLLWNSACTIAALLQEVLSIYPDLSSPNLTDGAASRVCNALALFQCVASHPDTRAQFLNAHIPLYLFPLLKTTSMTKPFEYLRLTSLGVIGALVKVDDAEAISFLLSVEIVPVCLCIMEIGSELSKTVATFIVHKILLNEVGIGYMCGTPERFFALCHVLRRMVQSLAGNPSQRLLKQIIRCYLTLSEDTRARVSLGKCLPETFMDPSFSNCLGFNEVQVFLSGLSELDESLGPQSMKLEAFSHTRHTNLLPVLSNYFGRGYDDTAAKQCLQQLLHNVSGTNQMAPAGLGHMW